MSSLSSSRAGSPHNLVFVHTASSPPASGRSSLSSRSSRGSFGSGTGSGRSRNSTREQSADEAEMEAWLKRYSEGALGPPDQIPKPPPIVETILEEAQNHPSPISPASSMFLMPGTTEHPLDQFRRLGHLQAPKAPWEEERLRLAERFGLQQPRRREALDAICKIVKAFFRMTTVVISLTFEDHQVLAGEVGWGGDEPKADDPPRPLTLEPAMCTHALISAPRADQTFITGNADEDWRFAGSPYVTRNGGALAFYAAANVMLSVDEADQRDKDLPETLPVGALCLISDKPRDPTTFTTEDRSHLRLFADMIARELTLGHEQRRRENETRKADVIGEFLNSALILPGKPPSPNASVDPSDKAFPAARPLTTPATVYSTAVNHLKALTSAGSAAILDLRSYRAPTLGHSPLAERPALQQRRDTFPGELNARDKLYLLGSTGDVDWEKVMEGDNLLNAVGDTILEFHISSTVVYDKTSHIQPMAEALAPTVTSTICLPLLDAGTGFPSLMLILTSSKPHFSFLESDVRFAKNIGAVTMSFLLKERAEAADKAKQDFLATLSHEIRTPLHGITSQVELVREFSTPSQLKRLAPLLDTADLCLESLSDVLNDTLDFSKLANSTRSSAEVREAHMRSLAPRNLEQLLEDCAKATWVRKKRNDLVSGGEAALTPGAPTVELILSVQDRPGGWKSALVDVGGLKRVILNLLGNSLKFTTQGYIKISLQEVKREVNRPPSSSNKATVRFSIEDTGIGMTDDFQRTKLFTPFVQENSFASGAGLGMSLCKTIVTRMQGEIAVASVLGKGTTVSFTLPIEFAPSSVALSPSTSSTIVFDTPFSLPTPTTSAPNGHPLPLRTRIISNELAELFNPGPAHLVLSSSPRSDLRQSFDFQQAVEAAQSSSKLVRMPSGRRRGSRGSLLGQRGDQDDLVHEAAKLALATTPDEVLAPLPVTVEAPSPTSSTSAAAPPRKVRVLVADDNSIARNIFIKLFTGKGIDFAAAEDGQQLVDLYKDASDSPFHLICTDVQMPNVDGVEASKMVREYEQAKGLPRCRIIALTGLSASESMLEGEHIDSWIVKGGKSMRVILDEIAQLQDELDNSSSSAASP